MSDTSKVMEGIELAWEHRIEPWICPDVMYRVVVAKKWKEREIPNSNWFATYPEEFLHKERELGHRIVSIDVYELKLRGR